MYPSLENSTTLITTTPTNRCQWTKIYGEEGPSQGASAPGAGRAGQCKTSADCASRVPYCSKLGYCHGGRLPFDEAQLEINVRVLKKTKKYPLFKVQCTVLQWGGGDKNSIAPTSKI